MCIFVLYHRSKKYRLLITGKIYKHVKIHYIGWGCRCFYHILMKWISNIMYVIVTKWLASPQHCFGVLAPVYKGEVQKAFSNVQRSTQRFVAGDMWPVGYGLVAACHFF
jgi:hypothetical protein